jgi:hypothetical protein
MMPITVARNNAELELHQPLAGYREWRLRDLARGDAAAGASEDGFADRRIHA